MMKYEVYQGSGRFTPFTADELKELEDDIRDLLFNWVQDHGDKDMFALDMRLEAHKGAIGARIDNVYKIEEDGNKENCSSIN